MGGNSLQEQRVLSIGAGRMARAIVSGLLRNKEQDGGRQITVANRADDAKLQYFRETYGVSTTERWQSAVVGSDVILLAIPPSEHPAMLKELAACVGDAFVITVAAGIGIEFFEEALPAGTPVAWVMPNTAADIGESISLYAYGTYVKDSHREVLQDILAGIGGSQECTEAQIHELTAITGSAPAFVYQFAGILEKMSMQYGMSEAQARTLVAQMLYGSARMLQQGFAPAELSDQVTSPGGATAAGTAILHAGKFDQLVARAVEAVNARAKQLVKE